MFLWKFKITEDGKQLSFEDLATSVFSEFGLKETECQIEKQKAIGSPGLRRLWITSIGFPWGLVYDIRVWKSESGEYLFIKMTVFPIVLSTLLFVLLVWAGTDGFPIKGLVGIFMLFVVFFGGYALFSLEGVKSQLKYKLKGLIED